MKLITRKNRAASAADAFREQYCHVGVWRTYDSWDEQPEVMHGRLLGMERTPDSVAEALGESWVMVECDECGASVEAAVEMGQEPDYESATATICIPCIRKAAALQAASETK